MKSCSANYIEVTGQHTHVYEGHFCQAHEVWKTSFTSDTKDG